MNKKVIKYEDIKHLTYQRKDGSSLNLREWFNELIYTSVILGFAIGLLSCFLATAINPSYISTVANQMCQSYDGYAISYKWDILNSKFGNVICKNSFGIFEPLK